MSHKPTTLRDDLRLDQVRILRLENPFLRVDLSPETGGRVTSIFHKTLGREFLWRNARLALTRARPGDPYDPQFYGGIDEVIPGDIPERIAGLDCPDHGELWTLPLGYEMEDEAFVLKGRLPRWGLRYHKRITLRPSGPWIDLDYQIENDSGERRVFMWKLHAAVLIEPGDSLVCPARTAAVADPQWSRWKTDEPFAWPFIQGKRADLIPPPDGTTDFLFLYDLAAGQVGCRTPASARTSSHGTPQGRSARRPAQGCELTLYFDRQVFPYVCYFAAYGGLDGHYTAVLEPCTAMPVSVNEAARLGQCSVLNPGSMLATRVSIYAGPIQQH